VKKICLSLFVAFLLCGCLFKTSDPAAERAFAVYQELHVSLPEHPVTLEYILNRTGRENHCAARIAFARWLILDGVKTPQAILDREKARIELNTFAGFLPSDNINYETGGQPEYPAEIPHISAAEKAALILDDGATEPLELLRKVRIAHAEAVAAMNEFALDNSPQKRLAYVICCIRLADAIGVSPAGLSDLDEFEQRFDSANARWEKSY
jgi:hypothetical protein